MTGRRNRCKQQKWK